MRLLLDECTPARLARLLREADPGLAVDHVALIGWAGTRNGKLLARLAESGYAGLITTDRNLAYQQPIAQADVFVVVLEARTNRLIDLAPLAARTILATRTASAGTVTMVR